MTTIAEKWPSSPPVNPFVRGEDGKIPSITAITTLCRQNPLQAVKLCKAAGEDLNKWFPNNPK